MKRMIACVLAVFLTSLFGYTNQRHNKTHTAVRKAAGFDLADYLSDVSDRVAGQGTWSQGTNKCPWPIPMGGKRTETGFLRGMALGTMFFDDLKSVVRELALGSFRPIWKKGGTR